MKNILFKLWKIFGAGKFFSLTPGFSQVWKTARRKSRFNGLPGAGKPLKRFLFTVGILTGLKPGVNEIFNSAGFLNSIRQSVLSCS